MQETVPLRVSLVLFLLFALHISSTRADIQTIEISNDTRKNIIFENFGFTSRGHLSVSVSSVSITTTNHTITPNASLFGIFVTPYDVDDYIECDCCLEKPNITILFTFSNLTSHSQSSFSKNISISKPANYDIVFARCGPKVNVSMKVDVETYNLDMNGHKDYLSDGESQVPMIYFLSSVIYIPFLIIWLYSCYKNMSAVKKIHHLMTILLVVKALNLFFEAESQYHIKVSGVARGWDVLFFTFQFIRGLLFFTVTFLIATGWSLLRPFVHPKVKWVLLVGIPLQLLENIVYLAMTEMEMINDGNGVMGFYALFFVIDTASCVMIMYPIEWSIATLRNNVSGDQTNKEDDDHDENESAVTTLKKLKLFRNFYWFLYFYTFSIKLFILEAKMDYEVDYQTRWMVDLCQELATLCFYAVMFYLFRPHESNQYFAVAADDNEEELAVVEINKLADDLPDLP